MDLYTVYWSHAYVLLGFYWSVLLAQVSGVVCSFCGLVATPCGPFFPYFLIVVFIWSYTALWSPCWRSGNWLLCFSWLCSLCKVCPGLFALPLRKLAIFCDWGIFYINCAFVYFGCSVLLIKTNVLKRVPMRTVIFGILVELHLSKRATITFEQARDKTYNKTFVTSKDSDLPAHPTSMTRVQVPFLITRGL